MVTSARTFLANPNLPAALVDASRRGLKDFEPEKPCTACNRCLVAAMCHTVTCLDQTRFPGKNPAERRKAMLTAGEKLYTRPTKAPSRPPR